jgi:glycosyltransferase involved in cell wall biosynthesis
MTSQQDEYPLVSIGLPVYNEEHFIRRSLDCLLSQDYGNIEIIVSDNCSSDSTWAILQDYASRDNRIRLNKNTANLGQVANLLKVLSMARGSFFMWAAADDEWKPEFVRRLTRELQDHLEAQVAMCAIQRTYENGTLRDIIRFNDFDSPNNKSHLQMALAVISKKKYNLYFYGLFRTDFVRQVLPFFVELPYADRWFVLLIAIIARLRYVDQVLYLRTIRSVSGFERYSDEVNKKLTAVGRLAYLRIIVFLARTILTSTLIPRSRRWYVVPIVWKYVGEKLVPGFRKCG